MSKKSSGGTGCAGIGCLGPTLGILLLWALLFGVTVNGQHYGLSGCSRDSGLEIDTR